MLHLFSGFAGLLKLQHIFHLTTDRYHLEVKVVRRVHNASDVHGYLRRLEDRDRESRKYVVLDCNAETTREIIISHVRDPFMGRRNYHFLLTGLVSRLLLDLFAFCLLCFLFDACCYYGLKTMVTCYRYHRVCLT